MNTLFSPHLWQQAIVDTFRKRNPFVGADIHVFMEKQEPDGTWKRYRDFSGDLIYGEAEASGDDSISDSFYAEREAKYPLTCDRNYRLFGALAGVREEGPEPNGWPEDRDPVYEPLETDTDLHSHCCYSLTDAAAIWKAHTNYGGLGTFGQVAPESIFFGVDTTTEDPALFRVLIAFDN